MGRSGALKADLVDRRYPNAVKWLPLTDDEFNKIYPVNSAEVPGTRANKRGFLATFSKITHYELEFDLARMILNGPKRNLTWNEVGTVANYIAEFIVDTNTTSLANYLCFLHYILHKASVGPQEGDYGVGKNIVAREDKQKLRKGNSVACRPVGAAQVLALPEKKRAPALLWFYTGLRKIHLSGLQKQDVQFESRAGAGAKGCALLPTASLPAALAPNFLQP